MVLNTYVMSRLCLWAEWRLRRDDGGLGYPRHSAFAKSPGAGFWSPEMDSAACEMDQCVCALERDLHQAVMEEYTRTGTQEQKAKRCGCCLATFKNRINKAHSELLGLMNDQAAGLPLPVHVYDEEKVALTA
jgi:DNA-directed RNA polymerase specialized sigma24 family protein